jgi:hypothetical protein
MRSEVFKAVWVIMLYFWISAMLPSIATSALKMETVCFSERLAYTDESTRLQNPEVHHQYDSCLS